MTKVSIQSDLHLEFDKKRLFVPEFYGENVLVLAGDVQVGLKKEAWFLDLLRGRDVVYVLGNHEFYHNDFTILNMKCADYAQEINDKAKELGLVGRLYLLQDQSIELHGVKFIGATLWTDFKRNDPLVRITAVRNMSDYSVINNVNNTLNTEDIYQANQKSIGFISDELDKPTTLKKFVVTHHLPSYRSVADMYKNPRDEVLNNMYYSDFDNIAVKADYWVHGHTHSSCDYMLDKCRVICNPRGYNAPGHLNKNFKEVVIDV